MNLLESRVMRKYQARFGGGLSEKELLLPRRLSTQHVGWKKTRT